MKKKDQTKVISVMGKNNAVTITVDKDYNLIENAVSLFKFSSFASAQLVAKYPFEIIGAIAVEEPKMFKKGYILIALNNGEVGPLVEFKDKDALKNAKLLKEIINK